MMRAIALTDMPSSRKSLRSARLSASHAYSALGIWCIPRNSLCIKIADGGNSIAHMVKAAIVR